MAFRLRHWIGVVVVSCGFLAAVLLPPKGRTGVVRTATQAPQMNAVRLAQGQLAKRIRDLRDQLEVARIRDEVVAQIDRETDNTPGPVVFANHTVSPRLRERVERQLRAQWADLGQPSEVAVALYLRIAEREEGDALGPPPSYGVTIRTLLPGLTDGSTCIRIVTINRNHRLAQTRTDRGLPTDVHQYGLGMSHCGFFAAFGEPSRSMTRWLAQTRYRFAEAATWNRGTIVEHASDDPLRRQPANAIFEFSADALACASGKLKACNNVLTDIGRGDRSSVPLRPRTAWLEHRVGVSGRIPALGWHLHGAEAYLLSNLVAQYGPDIFRALWQNDAPFETALGHMVNQNADEWTRSRVQAEVGVVHAGPKVGWTFVAISLVAGILSLGLATWGATRRQLN